MVFHNPRKEGCMIIYQQDMSGAVLQDSVMVVVAQSALVVSSR